MSEDTRVTSSVNEDSLSLNSCIVTSGGSRISKRRFPVVVEEVLILKSIQSIESYNVLYLRPLSIMS